MDAFRTFIDMGSYGDYVWPSYGLTVVIMAWLVMSTLRRLRAREQELARRQGEFPARRNRGGAIDTPKDAASS
ncbi:heme exporter protein CcmD [Denitrobaculum tricleocarpae]|uniref:Heme exporter protein D n=1 Tax=Denitrobaculum tricleocarpae TaxID=2591009 RepID=A0A545TR11_9PROT|nr:heme exporter protein CcmD [Denitrobaculum tricleocarpae]TQV79659.1 heme exporter protein CcmD [Denitrobaculum tricleocarpae]